MAGQAKKRTWNKLVLGKASGPLTSSETCITVDLDDSPESDSTVQVQPATGMKWLSFRGNAASSASLDSTTVDGNSGGSSSSGTSSDSLAKESWVYPARTTADKASEDKVIGHVNLTGDENDEKEREKEEDENNTRIALFRQSKVVSIGLDHPDDLCEPRAVRDTMPEPLSEEDDIRIPMSLVDEGRLSSPQLESVALATRRFRRRMASGERCGFLLGDGTGCGKGRCIAAVMLDAWNRGGRRSVWISATADLHADAKRDLADIRSGLKCCSMNRVKGYGSLDDMKGNAEVAKLGANRDGVLFVTYSMLVSTSGRQNHNYGDASTSRFGQVLQWLRRHNEDGDGVICFDEAHRAKNIDKDTKVGKLVLALQQQLTNCSVMYASATGATEVQHMQYMSRLGLWATGNREEPLNKSPMKPSLQQASFKGFNSFRSAVEKGGVAAMELVAVQLKSMGAMSCRSLAFTGTSFDLHKVPLSPEMRHKYDEAVELWADLRSLIEGLQAQKVFTKEAGARRYGAAFWAAQQRFFKGLIVAAKVPATVELAKAAVAKGEAVVMSMWSTNESVIAKAEKSRASESSMEGEAFLSGPELTFEQYIENILEPLVHEAGGGASLAWVFTSLTGLKQRVRDLHLPPNPLDDIIDQLGGHEQVAEMSGRTSRMVRNKQTGELEKQTRLEAAKKSDGDALDSINNVEQRAFQKGKKLYAIITEAASAGISLHADRRGFNPPVFTPRPRRMLCLELPWAADKAVQQLGRVHRSNQLSSPCFQCIVTDLGGEARFISAVTQRLRQLGAMTRGDRHAALGEDDAFKFGALDVMNGSYGRRGLHKLYTELTTHARNEAHNQEQERAKVDNLTDDTAAKVVEKKEAFDVPENWFDFSVVASAELTRQGVKLQDREIQKDTGMKTFLNRLLGCTCDVQIGLFASLASHMHRLSEADRRDGLLDEGVVSMNAGSRWGRLRKITEVGSKSLSAETPELHVRDLRLEKGFSYEEALQLYENRMAAPVRNVQQEAAEAQGFYKRHVERGKRPEALLLLLRRRDQPLSALGASYILYFPHVQQIMLFEGEPMTLHRLRKCLEIGKLERADSTDETIQNAWRAQHKQSESQCIHIQRGWRCQQAGKCEIGRRILGETMLTGPLLSYWTMIQDLPGAKTTLVRASIQDDRVLVGILLSAKNLSDLRQNMQQARALADVPDLDFETDLHGLGQLRPKRMRERPQPPQPPLGKKRPAPVPPGLQPPGFAPRYVHSDSDDDSEEEEDAFKIFQTPAAKRAFNAASASAADASRKGAAIALPDRSMPDAGDSNMEDGDSAKRRRVDVGSLRERLRERLDAPPARDQLGVLSIDSSSDSDAAEPQDNVAGATDAAPPASNSAGELSPPEKQPRERRDPSRRVSREDFRARVQQLKAMQGENIERRLNKKASSDHLPQQLAGDSMTATEQPSNEQEETAQAKKASSLIRFPSPPKYCNEVWYREEK
mmetsp:Transcript_56358/g.132128  ORF Transcript_56358/g.132128 Transcript_56358/m.132128 type:complete len:1472 (-) Transcript_56358:106-4521(-)